MEVATEPTLRPAVAKRLKERTIAEMLKRKFRRPDHLEEGPELTDRNTFEFIDDQTDLSRTRILFHGSNSGYLRNKAAKFLREITSVEKSPRDMSIIVKLGKIEAAPKESLETPVVSNGRLANVVHPPKKKKLGQNGALHTVPTNGASLPSIESVIRADKMLSQALACVERFHHVGRIIGTKTKEPFIGSADGVAKVDYHYFDADEALTIAGLSVAWLDHEPELIVGDNEDEHSVLRYELRKIDPEASNRPLNFSRKFTEGQTFLAAKFILSQILGIHAYESHHAEGKGVATFRFLDKGISTDEAYETLKRFKVPYLVHEERGRNFWVATNEKAERAFRTSGRKPTEIVTDLSGGKKAYSKKEGLWLVRQVLRDCLGWGVQNEYYYTANCSPEDVLQYVTINPKSDDLRERLKSNYPDMIGKLPLGVSASFLGLRVKNGKCFFVYFIDRQKLVDHDKTQIVRKGEEDQKPQTEKGQVPESLVTQRSTAPIKEMDKPIVGESRNLKILSAILTALNDDEKRLAQEFLSGTDKSEVAIANLQRKLETKLADYQLIRTEDPRVKMIMGFADPSIFKDPVEVLKDILK